MRDIEVNYYCDYCKKKLGNKQHVSIHIKNYAGIVCPPVWKHLHKLEDRPYQFCDIDNCLAKFLIINKIKKEHKKEKKKKTVRINGESNW